MNKTQIYNSNLCKEITMTAQAHPCVLGTVSFDYGVFYAPYIPKNMNKSKYQFGRKKWYEGKFDWRKYDEVHDWCEQNFGKHDKRPDAWSRWNHMYEDMILFRDEKDYILFVLRWGA